MTGPEHDRRAEELPANIPRHTGSTVTTRGVKEEVTAIDDRQLRTIALAQVHATLAAAAATALGTAAAEDRTWRDVAGTRFSAGGS